ncbi:MAG TPA: type II toxin-antitoxin system RelE/ParE family toxin [Pyrinomonadaceae bacterium]
MSSAPYTVTLSRAAQKEMRGLNKPIFNRVLPEIRALASAPRPTGCRKLTGEENLWRIRVGDYRVLYSIDDSARTIDVIAVRHRSKAYE